MPPEYSAFTAHATGITRVLVSKVGVSVAFDPGMTTKPPQPEQFIALWDTGATGTVLTQKAIDKCGLKPTGMTDVHTASGPGTSPTYLVNVFLPNRVMMAKVKVTKGTIHGDIDVLIGMDIISQGDFAISNHQGKTAFTFRYPSCECIDFVKTSPKIEERAHASPQAGRNAPCPCGSGKKYKRCCGKNL